MSETPHAKGVARRTVLAAAASALAAVVVAPGVRLFAFAEAASTQPSQKRVRLGMLIDVTQCPAGCDACVRACNQENGLSGRTGPTDAQWIRKVEVREAATGRTASVPVMCQHCASPACVDVCPTNASFKRADGIVLVDRHRCIGCRYCMIACPYKARSFVHEPLADQRADVPRGKGCVEGCTMCVHRIDRGLSPACADACPAGAIVFGDMNDPASAIGQQLRSLASTQMRADLGLDPGVRYRGF